MREKIEKQTKQPQQKGPMSSYSKEIVGFVVYSDIKNNSIKKQCFTP